VITGPISIIPALVAAGVGGVLLLLALLVSIRSAVLVLGTMIFFSSIAIILDYDKNLYRTWLLPLQFYRAELYGFFGAVLLVGFIPRIRFLSPRLVSGTAWALIAAGLFSSLMRFFHTDAVAGFTSLAILFGATVPLALILPALLSSEVDATRLLRVIPWSMAAWVAAVAVQFVLDRHLVVLGVNNRFTGLISNCNQAGTMLAVASVTTLWLSLNDRITLRPLYIAMTVVFTTLLIWTGSRGSFGMFVIGASAVFYGRAGRVILLLPVFALVAYGAYSLVNSANIELGAGRLLSTQNTRADPWGALARAGLENPITGVGIEKAEASENSYLLGFASFGVGMLLLLLIVTAVAGIQCWRLFRLRKAGLPRRVVSLIDLCLGQNALYFAGAIFEGYMNGRVSYHLVTLLMFAAVGTFILRRYGAGQELTAEDPLRDEPDEEALSDSEHPWQPWPEGA
jgi:hypothetical protein